MSGRLPPTMSTLHDVPKPLTKLIRIIMRGFYSVEQKLVIDMLVRRRETKEDDLIEVLKIERKHMRSIMQQMRQDKFINVRLIMETDEDGKSTRRNYYSINYRMFVNVVKYKIDHVRRKLETEERDLTSRASFKCQKCKKTYTDLELGLIFNPSLGQFRCSYCDGIVDEDPDVRPQADSRMIMVKFNEQMKPVYDILKETEHIKEFINEADRNNLSANLNSGRDPSQPAANGQNSTNLTNGSTSGDQQNLGSTINSNPQINYPVQIIGLEEMTKRRDLEARTRLSSLNNPEIEALLLREETQSNSSQTVQESSHDEDGSIVMIGSDSILTINVGQAKVPIDKISEEHVELMTKQQRDDYIRLMQHIYSLVFT